MNAPTTTPRGIAWHTLSPEDCLQELKSSRQGLSPDVATQRLSQFGANEIQSAHHVSPWQILLAQFKNVLILILLVAVVLSAILGHQIEAIAIGVIVLFAALLGFVQEYRAERSMEALRELAAPNATVIRQGKELKVAAREIVPGDVVLLHVGDKVPADGRLLEAVNLQVEESSLTGESVPVEKQTKALSDAGAVGDRTNMVYAGTAVTYGRGVAVVAETGMGTEFGKVAQMLQSVEAGQTPLQENLDRLGKTLARAAFVVIVVIVAIGLFRGQPFVEMLIFGIALAVAVVPEALPAVVTISLAIGVQRMVRRNALVRRLPAVETLGATSVICSDKTGTLTRDEMTARKLFVADQWLEVSGSGYHPEGQFSANGAQVQPSGVLLELLTAGALASDTQLAQEDDSPRWTVKGDPTEGAVVVAAAKAGLEKPQLEADQPRVNEIPFTSETKRMTTLHQHNGGVVAYTKGAPEVILPSCSHYLSDEGERPLSDGDRERRLEAAQQMASEALRVLGVARRENATLEDAQREMTFLGLVGMIDPPRSEAKEAIAKCEQAGIKVVMITGDHPLTARAVARELGLLKHDRIVTGAELEQMTEDELARQVEEIEVYARVSPADKLRVVSALQDRGHVAAMTGDGINDAPALKKAAIGIAMGITGTDVTKEAAAMTLTDDNFASIVAAVEEGRIIFGNIKKYLMYLLSSNIGEIGLMTGATLLGYPLPMSAVQLLYVNLATDGLPALALAVDPPESDIMARPPRRAHQAIFIRPVLVLMLVGGAWSTIINLGQFLWAMRAGYDLPHAMTFTFVTLVLIEFFKAYNFRSDHHSVFVRPFANKWLNRAILWEILLLLLIIYVPVLRIPFKTVTLEPAEWIRVILLASTVSPVLEIAKWMERRGWFGALD